MNSTMAGTISQQLEELLNPLPKFVDPEDDHDEETKAKVIDQFDEGEDEEGVSLSGLRKQAIALLPETDRRYLGKATSRKELEREIAGSGEEDDDDDEEEEDEDQEEDGNEDDDEEEEEEGDDDEAEGDEEDEDLDDGPFPALSEEGGLVSRMKRADLSSSSAIDFQKLTEGMDDLGESEEDDMEESAEEDGSSEEDEDEDEDEMEDGEEGAVMTFSKEKVDEEVEKGKAVKDQLALWDQLLEGRIKIQKALVTANQLPQPHTFPEFKRKGGEELAGALKNSHKALKALQRSLLELQDQLLYQNPDTRPISLGKTWGAPSEDEEIPSDEDEQEAEARAESGRGAGPPKRKLETAAYPDFMAKRFAAFQPYRDATLQKWHDKTRLATGKSGKGFGAFDRSILTQVEQVLMDKERLLRRTQTRRSEYRVLGNPEAPPAGPEAGAAAEGEEGEHQLKANTHLKDLDEEIFDDDDFYHQLLRELIERKTSAADPNDQVAMGRQWLAIQKLRSKIKKRVDTKASKGRKVRFQIHSKMVNFMAPIDHGSMNDDARTELYRSLFGKNSFGDGAVRE